MKPKPYTLHLHTLQPTPYTNQHPTSCSLHPTPYTLLLPLTPSTLIHSPYNLHPTPHTLHPTPYPSGCDPIELVCSLSSSQSHRAAPL